MNKNIAVTETETQKPETAAKAFLVLSIGNMEDMLRAARKLARRSSAHPGKAPKRFCRVIYMDILGPEHNTDEGEAHVSSTSFMASATR